MSRTIDFHKTSNMAIEIKEMYCDGCDKRFYELDGHELENCPTCDYLFSYEVGQNDSDNDTYLLIVDPETGIPSVVRRDGKPMLDTLEEEAVKPGDTVNVINEIQFPFLKKVIVDHIEWHRGGRYAKLLFEEELYTIPLRRVVLAPKVGEEQ